MSQSQSSNEVIKIRCHCTGFGGGEIWMHFNKKKNGQYCLADFSNNKSILHLSEDQRSLYVQEQVANVLLQTSETSFLGLAEGNLKPDRRKKNHTYSN